MELINKKISVIGMGRTGVPTANFLAARGAEVLLTDQQEQVSLENQLKGLSSKVRATFGTSLPSPDADMIVLSPGLDIN